MSKKAKQTDTATLQARTLPEILRRLSDGEGLATICRMPSMPDRVTVLRWCAADLTVEAEVRYAREAGFEVLAERILQTAMTATDANLARMQVDAMKWYLGKLSNAFAERPPKAENQTNVQVNINGGNPLGQFAEIMDRAARAISSGGSSTRPVVDDSEA